MKPLIVAVAVLLLLAGCSASAVAESTPTPSATPTPEFATENQVASVIAGYGPDWREMMDGAIGCRGEWTFNPGSIPGYTCWLAEQTMSVTAETAVRDLAELKIPPSMAGIVADTTGVLQGIVDVKVKTICGEGEAPIESDECNKALGSLNFYYVILDGKLDAWAPYL
ncbi:hypothetical protein [Leifsonia sp. Leaf264]|uniref:hypothetical protein n=1 Tax=Leifsonia sp. Leaf264 TaxID=1736314 RepID=UPI00070121B2|nr:hypothetical protein [Leifsonia sp. Leaf264]KQO97504.1 hypothetical protein ASF30_13820 [Leifsonia sp. Leaf264]